GHSARAQAGSAIERHHLTAGIASENPRVGRFRGSWKATVLRSPGGAGICKGVRALIITRHGAGPSGPPTTSVTRGERHEQHRRHGDRDSTISARLLAGGDQRAAPPRW